MVRIVYSRNNNDIKRYYCVGNERTTATADTPVANLNSSFSLNTGYVVSALLIFLGKVWVDIFLFFCVCAFLSFSLYVCLSVCFRFLSVTLAVCLLVRQSISQSVCHCLIVCLSACLSVYPCLSIHTSPFLLFFSKSDFHLKFICLHISFFLPPVKEEKRKDGRRGEINLSP